MGNKNSGDAHVLLKVANEIAHFKSQMCIQIRQRFVQQQHIGLYYKRTGQRHALLLATGKLTGSTRSQVGQFDQIEHVFDASIDLALRYFSHLQTKADIGRNTHVGKQQIVLKHHNYTAVLGFIF